MTDFAAFGIGYVCGVLTPPVLLGVGLAIFAMAERGADIVNQVVSDE